MKKFWKKKIDERQQAELNKVGNYGFWLAFWLLLASIMVQGVILHRPFREWAAEWIIFMLIAVFEVIADIKIGVWTEYTQRPGLKSYLINSLLFSGSFSVLFTLGNCTRFKGEITAAYILSNFFTWFFGLFVLMAAGLAVSGWIYNRRMDKLEEKLDEEIEDEDE